MTPVNPNTTTITRSFTKYTGEMEVCSKLTSDGGKGCIIGTDCEGMCVPDLNRLASQHCSYTAIAPQCFIDDRGVRNCWVL